MVFFKLQRSSHFAMAAGCPWLLTGRMLVEYLQRLGLNDLIHGRR